MTQKKAATKKAATKKAATKTAGFKSLGYFLLGGMVVAGAAYIAAKIYDALDQETETTTQLGWKYARALMKEQDVQRALHREEQIQQAVFNATHGSTTGKSARVPGNGAEA